MESQKKNREQKLSAALIVFVWLILGVASYVMSVKCFNSPKSRGSDNLAGVIIAIFLGPLYWIYFAMNKSYCR